MNPKQLKKLKKRIKKAQKVLQQPKYIEELTQYRDLFDPFPEVKFLINNALESDRLLKKRPFTTTITSPSSS